MLARNLTDSLYTVTNYPQAHVTQVIPINKLSDKIGPSFRQYVCDGTAITRKFTYFYITAPTLTSKSMVIDKHHLPEHEI